MPVKKLKDFLDNQKVKYISMLHSPAFTSQEIAAAAHVSGKQLAKTVIVIMDDQMAMIVLPASQQIDFTKLKEVTGASQIDLASESAFKGKFPECEVGSMPPFGNLYDMPVFVCECLGEQDQIVFNAGSHAEVMQIAYSDFARLVEPKVIAL